MRQHDVNVPKIRSRPKQLSHEQWEQYVESLFPKYSTATHKLLQVAPDLGAVQFDVVPIIGGESNASLSHRVVIRGEHRGDSHCTCAAFRFGIYGMCPHILFAFSQLRQARAVELLSPERPYSEVFVRHGLNREIIFRASPDAPRVVLKAAKYCFDGNGRFAFDRLPYLKTLIDRAADCRHELLIDDDVFGQIAFQSQQKERHRRIIATFRRGANSKAFGTLLTAPLATYQREAALNAAIAGRFLLFDSPGLGRRRTALAAAEILAQTSGVRRVLVLTNVPTLHTWRLELQQSTPRKSQVIWGSPAKRSELYAADVQYAIASYDDLKNDIDAIIGRMRPDLIILDETHTLKRHGAETARIVRRLESEFLFVLSGADPARVPGPFVSFVDMIDRCRTGLLDGFLARHQQFDLRKNSVAYINMGHVANTLPQCYRRFESAEYRRSLPELIEHDRFLPMTTEQAKRHADLQNRLFHLATPWRQAIAQYKKHLQEKNATAQPNVESPATTPEAQDATPQPANNEPKHEPELKPVVVPTNTLHEIQATIAEMLRVANDITMIDLALMPSTSSNSTQTATDLRNRKAGCKLETMFDLLQEHLESPQVKAVVFAHEPRFLKAAQSRLIDAPIEHDLVDRYTPLPEQKAAGTRFLQEPNFRVLFVGDGVAERLVLRNVQLVIHLDLPWDSDRIRQRHAIISAHPTFRPCHAYRLISYGTVEHWLAKLHGGHELFLDSDLRDGQSVVLFDEPARARFFEHVIALLEQVNEAPMVVSAT